MPRGPADDEGCRIEALNRLAFPKGQNPVCETTGLAATVQCVTPHVTLYYATTEHAEQAWRGIMRKIGPLIGPLRNPAPIVGSKEDRERKLQVVEASFTLRVKPARAKMHGTAHRTWLILHHHIQHLLNAACFVGSCPPVQHVL
jgi:hypothetical protein